MKQQADPCRPGHFLGVGLKGQLGTGPYMAPELWEAAMGHKVGGRECGAKAGLGGSGGVGWQRC